jgi:cytochrome b-561
LKAILVYRVFRDVKKLPVKILHASLLALSLIFASVGLKAVFDSHNLAKPPMDNLNSIHSWIGLTTVTLFGLQWICGFVNFLFPKLNENIRRAYMPRYTIDIKFFFSFFN